MLKKTFPSQGNVFPLTGETSTPDRGNKNPKKRVDTTPHRGIADQKAQKVFLFFRASLDLKKRYDMTLVSDKHLEKRSK